MRSRTLFAALALMTASFAHAATPAAPPVPAGAYSMDKVHTSLLFRVKHLAFSNYTGRFTAVDAKLQFDPANIAAAHVDVTVDPTSLTTDNAPTGFLGMLTGKDWLDAAKYPALTFRSTKVELTQANNFRIHGDLTLHGITQPVILDAKFNGGYAGHPMEPRARVGFSAHGTFKRSDFGVTAGIPAPGTTMGVGDEVEVIVESEFTGPPLAK